MKWLRKLLGLKLVLSFDLKWKWYKELDQLRIDCGLDSMTELFNYALTVLWWAVCNLRKGRKIVSIDHEKGTYKEIHMPFFDKVKRGN
jgi:hypothetical protein